MTLSLHPIEEAIFTLHPYRATTKRPRDWFFSMFAWWINYGYLQKHEHLTHGCTTEEKNLSQHPLTAYSHLATLNSLNPWLCVPLPSLWWKAKGPVLCRSPVDNARCWSWPFNSLFTSRGWSPTVLWDGTAGLQKGGMQPLAMAFPERL